MFLERAKVYTLVNAHIQTMAFGAAFAANFFNGLNTSAWTVWVFFAVFIGDVLIWVYTVSLLTYHNESTGLTIIQSGHLQHYLPRMVRHADIWQ